MELIGLDIFITFDKRFFTIGEDFKILVHGEIDKKYLKGFNENSIELLENPFLYQINLI